MVAKAWRPEHERCPNHHEQRQNSQLRPIGALWVDDEPVPLQ